CLVQRVSIARNRGFWMALKLTSQLEKFVQRQLDVYDKEAVQVDSIKDMIHFFSYSAAVLRIDEIERLFTQANVTILNDIKE
ncbi:hypothetical protein CHS0354_004666, partial [Potamilus streckersoni]